MLPPRRTRHSRPRPHCCSPPAAIFRPSGRTGPLRPGAAPHRHMRRRLLPASESACGPRLLEARLAQPSGCCAAQLQRGSCPAGPASRMAGPASCLVGQPRHAWRPAVQWTTGLQLSGAYKLSSDGRYRGAPLLHMLCWKFATLHNRQHFGSTYFWLVWLKCNMQKHPGKLSSKAS